MRLKAFPLSFTAGFIVSSGSLSVVFLFTVSPQTPTGRSLLFMQAAYWQFETSQSSSVHLHQTVLPRLIAELLPHLNNSQVGEHFFSDNLCTTIFIIQFSKLSRLLHKHYMAIFVEVIKLFGF
jgi:hypothetical protein